MTPTVPADDRGLLLGDGLFETLLWEDGGLVDPDLHWARLARGCQELGLPAPSGLDCDRACFEAVRRAELREERAAVRLTVTAGSGGRGLERPVRLAPRLFATAAFAAPPEGPVRLAFSSVVRNEGSPASRLKTLSYLDSVLARREALAAGADEALMLNAAGEIACASAANVFWFDGEALCTPALDCGVLDGIVRGRVIEAARALGLTVREVRANVAALKAATGLFLTNSLIGLRPVESLEGGAVAADPRVAELARAVGVRTRA